MIYAHAERLLFISRLSLGWLMLYAGWTKIINETWTAGPYLLAAKTLPGLFAFFASPDILPYINFANKWGLFLLGISLITGVWVRASAPLGAVLMLLYYLPVLAFPYAGHGFLVDEHVIYGLLLLVFMAQSQPFQLNEPAQWLKRLAQSIKTRKVATL